VLLPAQAQLMTDLEREQLFDWLRKEFKVDPMDVSGIRLVPTQRKVVITTLVRGADGGIAESPYMKGEPWTETETHPMRDKPPLIDHYTIEELS
jgi:hypothetical protein